jgi:predicted 2-oxoglutarate/Fe(II)-dependent dioxygenase YbiX
MKLHCDHIHSLFDGERKGVPVLTILGVLNDDYEGGDLVLWEDTYMRPKKGSVLVFPSNFLYPHKVDTITKGTRYSFVSWAW